MAETCEDLYLSKVHPSLNAKTLRSTFLNRWKEIVVPTNAGWTTSNVGSGGVTQAPFLLAPYTGLTANSRGLATAIVFGLNSGALSRYYIDWTKRLELNFIVLRLNSDSEVVAHFQLKEIATEGILAERGIGLSIANYTVTGEAYGTARGTAALGTLTDDRLWRVRIIKEAGRVEFWVKGVLVGTLTGAAVPNVVGTENVSTVVSIINGATGGVNALLYVYDVKIVQEW